MLAQSTLLRVNPLDIRDGEPMPHDIYSADGVLLCAEGQTVAIPEQSVILQASGWRKKREDEPVMEQPETGLADEASLRLPARPRLPLAEAQVLIAEDMALARDLLIKLLNEQGLRNIAAVDNGHAAITHFFQHRPHIVFLDIYMPPRNGFEALKQIKTWCPDNFVCMASGDCTPANAEEARLLGVNAFIIKPISPLNLKRVLALYEK
mgnify:CR=1 FL=1